MGTVKPCGACRTYDVAPAYAVLQRYNSFVAALRVQIMMMLMSRTPGTHQAASGNDSRFLYAFRDPAIFTGEHQQGSLTSEACPCVHNGCLSDKPVTIFPV